MPNILQRLLSPRPPAAKAGLVTEALLLSLELGSSGFRTYPQLVHESYDTNSVAHQAIKLTAQSSGSVPLLLYQSDRRGDEQLVDQHPLLELLARPNAGESGRRFRSLLYADLTVAGEAFILDISTATGSQRELHLLRPDSVTVRGTGRVGSPAAYEYRDGRGNVTTYGPDQVLHVRTLDLLRTGRGFSSVRAVANDLDQSNLAGKWNVSLLKNAGRPSLLILTRSPLTAQQKTQLREQQEALLAGAGNAGRIATFSGDEVTVKDLGFSPNDMDWLEGKRAAESRIATGIGVPPELLNLGQTTFNNRSEAKRSFYEETVQPLVTLVLDELNAWLVPKYDAALRLEAYWERVAGLQPDRQKEYERLDNAFTAGWLKINEVREEAGFDPDDVNGELYKWQADAVSRFGIAPPAPPGKSAKMLLRSEEAKAAYWKAIDAQKLAFEATIARRLRRAFDEERLRIKAKLPDLTTAQALEDFATRAQDPAAVDGILKPAYIAVIEHFGRHTLDTLGVKQAKALEDVFSTVFQEALDFIESNVAIAVRQVDETTKAAIRRLILDGVTRGDSIPNLAKAVDSLYLEQIIPNRSTVIARTEVIKSSNAGSQLAAKGTGIPMTKTWLATRDNRTRDPHAAADGQTVPANVPFTVGGEQLMYPGDPSGSPWNVIQCRCVATYHPVERPSGND